MLWVITTRHIHVGVQMLIQYLLPSPIDLDHSFPFDSNAGTIESHPKFLSDRIDTYHYHQTEYASSIFLDHP